MITNDTRHLPIATRPRFADTLGWRLRGLIGRRFDDFDALVFPRCGSIHMAFMSMAIDVLFLDRDGVVVGLRHGLRPWRLAAARRAVTTIELPAGTLARSGTEAGDRIRVERQTR